MSFASTITSISNGFGGVTLPNTTYNSAKGNLWLPVTAGGNAEILGNLTVNGNIYAGVIWVTSVISLVLQL